MTMKPFDFRVLEQRLMTSVQTPASGDLYGEVSLATGLSRPTVKSLALQVMYSKQFDGVQDVKSALIKHLNRMIALGVVKKDRVATDEEKAQKIADELNRPGGGK